MAKLSMMHWFWIVLFALAAFWAVFRTARAAIWWSIPDPARAADSSEFEQEHGEFEQSLEKIRARYKLPALAAALARADGAVQAGAVGVRVAMGKESVTVEDRFHIGSCTKSMTAMLIAMLMEEGKLSWDTTIAQSFPELSEKIRPEYRAVTVEQLLAHRSGLPEDRRPDKLFLQLRSLTGPIRQQRLQVVEAVLNQAPAAPPGTKMFYSNSGYVIAGAMAEQAADASWEELMREKLFRPLGMTTAGFGPPGSRNRVDQPRGHLRSFGWLIPMAPSDEADNPAWMGPAGTVHCSIADFARYAVLHANGPHGGSELLSAESFEKLHQDAYSQEYALGWLVTERGWAGGKALTHAGSNGLFYAVAWVAPAKRLALVAATNCGAGAEACDTAVAGLLD